MIKHHHDELIKRYVPRLEWLQNGWMDKTDVTISFTNGTRVFEIAPAASYYDYYVNGHRHRSNGDTITIANSDGQHWIYYDDDGTLSEIVGPSHAQVEDLIRENCLVAAVYWNTNTSEGYLFDELHGMTMAPETHHLFHDCIGMLWAEGVGLTNILADQSGALNTHCQFGNGDGLVYDEDNQHEINTIASTTGYECFWWDGTRWQWDTNAGYPFLVGGTPRAQYNNYGAGTLVEVGNANFCLTHLFATAAEDDNPIIVVGQTEYTTITAAREGAATEISAILLEGLPSPEMKPMGTVILQSSNAYGNAMQTRIRSATGGHDYVDWRTNPISPGGGTVTDHGSLGGLGDDDHSQYLKEKASGGAASEIPVHDHSAAAEAGQLDHGAALTGLADDDHSAYPLVTNFEVDRATIVTNWTDLTDAGATTLHKHDHGDLDGFADDDHTQYLIGRTTMCRVHHNANQNVNNATVTTLAFNQERFDPDGIHDTAVNNSRITPGTTGTYIVGANIQYATDAGATGSRDILIDLNGGGVYVGHARQKSGTNSDSVNCNVLWRTAAGTDYFEIDAYQTSGGALNVNNTASRSPEFWCMRVQ